MEHNLADLFECTADTVPDRVALVYEDRRLTFADLEERSNRLAHHLTEAGVGPGDHVGIYCYNRSEYLEAMLAAFKIRAVPINVNYRYVEDELRYLFTNADIVALIHDRCFSPRVAAVREEIPTLRHLVLIEDGSAEAPAMPNELEYEAALAAASAARDFPSRSADDLYILYTGGTTGMPKGVMWRHEDVFYAAMGGGGGSTGRPITSPEEIADRAQAPAMTMLTACPFMHATGQWGGFSTLLTGGKLVIDPMVHFDAGRILGLIEQERVNTLLLVGDASVSPIIDALEKDVVERPGHERDLRSLRVLMSSGAMLSPKHKETMFKLMPKLIIFDGFGSSESGMQATTFTAAEQPLGELRFKAGANTTVVDEQLRPVERGSGAIGRVASKARVPIGYYKDPDKTAATFVEIDGDRWVIPGDMATIDTDGTIRLLGRGSLCINSGGEKIYPEEVESALRSHPDVADAVVIGMHDDRWGEHVTAVVSPRPGCVPTLDQLDAHCRTTIAGYKVPRELHLVERVERLATGKPDYAWAKDIALAQPSET